MRVTSLIHDGNPRAWIWASVCVQFSGLAFDALWHGLLNPGFEAVTVSEMVTHLVTVHLLLYIGVVSVLLSTGWALLGRLRRAEGGVALPIAFAGALLSTAAEVWHAYTHLQLSTHAGAIAGSTAFVGLVVVVATLRLSRPTRQRREDAERETRRAA